MTRGTNVGEEEIPTYHDLNKEWLVYENLPYWLRHMMQNADKNYSCIEVAKVYLEKKKFLNEFMLNTYFRKLLKVK